MLLLHRFEKQILRTLLFASRIGMVSKVYGAGVAQFRLQECKNVP